MDLRKDRPLTTAEAKENLRLTSDLVAQRLSPGEWVRRNPYGALAVGFLGGMLLSRVRAVPLASVGLVQLLRSLL